ncbi:cell division control protein 42 homolog isoform X2 [Ischnura elegans]|uniref:cell division control protein 42 homolog isoform X2 n=1 Tax=Ischnura elegans TaxID=197161 RepID=UPI001ED8AFDB|nr:cell division control protein 42 homolog isoform X2 [Ischnura elegans]
MAYQCLKKDHSSTNFYRINSVVENLKHRGPNSTPIPRGEEQNVGRFWCRVISGLPPSQEWMRQDEYDSLRPLSYPGSDVFLLCFSIDNPMSLENVKYKWVPELKSHSPEVVPIILIGNKIDLRGKSRRTVATQTGQRVAKELGLEAYSECSALTQVGVKNVFDLAITAALKHRAPRKRKNKCILL